MTAAGHPDLQGHWTNDTYTPLERPAELGDKATFTAEEAAAFFKSRVDELLAQAADDIHYDDAIWQAENYDEGGAPAHVVDRSSRATAGCRRSRRAARTRCRRQRATQRATSADSAPSRSLAERCISWGNVGPPMMPPTYNANLQILQSKDLVVIRHEMMHDVRTIYLDGRPHPPPSIQWLAGHSVGRFEGETLVVDTTNFTPLTNFRGSPQNTRQDIFASERMHVVERFTRTGDDTMHYAFTVEDPDTWSRAVVGRDGHPPHRGADLRVRVPRGQLRPREHPARGARRRTAVIRSVRQRRRLGRRRPDRTRRRRRTSEPIVTNWRDEPPSADALRLAAQYEARPAVADDDNAFIYLLGFDAALGENPRAVGAQRLVWLRRSERHAVRSSRRSANDETRSLEHRSR